MLHRGHLINALEERRDDFIRFERTLGDEVGEAASRLRALVGRESAEVLEETGAPASRVTFPSGELDTRGGIVVSFDELWRSHEEARAWALRVLRDRVTFAADGSQIFPGREL
ncbi:MAG: hypothetical protein WCD76_22060, partial [Pyrinomonadaceae bacterium]